MTDEKHRQNQIGNALIFAVRYALPRKASADMACNTMLKTLWHEVPESHRSIIIEEIRQGENSFDFSLWADFLRWEKKQ